VARRKSRVGSSKHDRRKEAAVKLLVAGAAMVLVPMLLGNSTLGKALSGLVTIGIAMFAIGGVMLWVLTRGPGTAGTRTDTANRSQPQQVRRAAQAASSSVRVHAQVKLEAGQIIDRIAAGSKQGSKPSLRPTSWSPAVFATIEWRRFEALVEALFQQAGFETKSQSHGADEGIDIWLFSRSQGVEPVSLVQCKHWQAKRVGVDKIRELRGVMAAKGVKRGQFATTTLFTPDAESFARENSINLLDVDRLLELISTRTTEQQQELLAVALQGDYWRPTCVNCGVKMVERASTDGGNAFWGCTGFPKCRTTMAMRTARQQL
jgi:restriction system protein